MNKIKEQARDYCLDNGIMTNVMDGNLPTVDIDKLIRFMADFHLHMKQQELTPSQDLEARARDYFTGNKDRWKGIMDDLCITCTPNEFIKELSQFAQQYHREKMEEFEHLLTDKKIMHLRKAKSNSEFRRVLVTMFEGINY